LPEKDRHIVKNIELRCGGIYARIQKSCEWRKQLMTWSMRLPQKSAYKRNKSFPNRELLGARQFLRVGAKTGYGQIAPHMDISVALKG
jgi:hypothetical protein